MEILEAILIFGIIFAILGWLLWRSLKKSDDAMRTASRVGLAGVLIGLWVIKILPMAAQGGEAAIIAVIGSLPIAIILAILATPAIGRWLASPLAGLYDGGSAPIIPHANYNIAEARIMKNDFRGAATEIRNQLAKFPGDLRGWLLLAELQAGKLDDMDGAMESLDMVLLQVDAPAHVVAAAANLAADLHLKFKRDPDAARAKLQEIIERHPDSTQAQKAAERIGHLPTKEQLDGKAGPQSLTLQRGHRDLGLKPVELLPQEASADERSYALHLQLDIHPGDSEAREKLVGILAEELHDVEGARGQIHLALSVPNIAVRQQTRWLHLLAAIEIRHAKDLEAAKRALQRIVANWPGSAYADVAERRIATLALELKDAAAAPEALVLGVYERDLGLKKTAAPEPTPEEAADAALPALAPAILRTADLFAPKPQPETKPAQALKPKPVKRPSIKID